MKYWNEKGTHQKEFTRLTEELVPTSGSADTLLGETIRCMNNVYYDLCNNGGWNLGGEGARKPDFLGLVYHLRRLGFEGQDMKIIESIPVQNEIDSDDLDVEKICAALDNAIDFIVLPKAVVAVL